MLSHTFMQYSLIVGILLAIISAFLGSFIVASRQALISDLLAHASLLGVGIGVYFNLDLTFSTFIVAFTISVILFLLNQNNKTPPEAISMMILTSSIAVTVALVHSSNTNISLDNFLFGSILTISKNQLILFAAVSLVLLIVLIVFYNKFLLLCLNKNYFAQFKQFKYYELLFLLLVATLISVAIKIVGALLIGGLLVIPVICANILATNFKMTIWISILINLIASIGGIIFSYYVDIPTTSAIIIFLVSQFLVLKTYALTKN